MSDGIPENTNPFVVLVSWNNDVELHRIAPEYFSYDAVAGMPFAKEVGKPALTQSEAEALVRRLIIKDRRIAFVVHEKFKHIIPDDLKKVVRIASTYSASHSKKGFYVPCCTEDECRYLK